MAFTGRFGHAESQFGQIEFGFDISADTGFDISVETVLELDSAVSETMLFSETVEETINLDSEPLTGFTELIDETLDLVQTVIAGIVYDDSVESTLEFTQDTQIAQNVFGIQVETVLELNQNSGVQFEETVETTLTLTDSITSVIEETAETTLDLAQTVDFTLGVHITTTLILAQTVTSTGVFGAVVNQTLQLNQAVTYTFSRSSTCQYDPAVGSSSDPDAPDQMEGTAPTLGSAVLTLTYPYLSPTMTFILRNPEFANTDSLQFNRINRQTRGGRVIIYSVPTWPKQQVLSLAISALTQDQIDDLFAFLAASLGDEIGLLDHENRQWKGIILNPGAEVTDQGNGTCRFGTSLEFEGELV